MFVQAALAVMFYIYIFEMTFDFFSFSNDNCMHGFLALLINKCLC